MKKRFHYKKTGRVGRHDLGVTTHGDKNYVTLYLFSPNSENGVSLNANDYALALRKYNIEAVLCVAPKADMRILVSVDTMRTRVIPNVFSDTGPDGEYYVITKKDLVGEEWDGDEIL